MRPNINRAIRQPSTVSRVGRAPLQPFEQRRAEVDRQDALRVANHKITGFLHVFGSGEVAVGVGFPIWFVEKPSMTYGSELAEGHTAERLNMPTCSVVVLRWDKVTRDMASYWTGATLAIVTTGKADHQMQIQWHMEGQAFVNPLTNSGTSATL